MKLAIMQPYFFPYLGYFDLIHNVDLFVVFDTVQFTKRGLDRPEPDSPSRQVCMAVHSGAHRSGFIPQV